MTQAVPSGEHWHQPPPGLPAPAGSHLPAGQLPAEKPNQTCAGSSSGPPKSSPIPKPTSPDRESLATAKAPDRPLEYRLPPAVRLSESCFQCLCTSAAGSHWFGQKLETLQRPADCQVVQARRSQPRTSAVLLLR